MDNKKEKTIDEKLECIFEQLLSGVQQEQNELDYLEQQDKRIEVLENALLEVANRCQEDSVSGLELITCLEKNGLRISQGKNFIWEKTRGDQ